MNLTVNLKNLLIIPFALILSMGLFAQHEIDYPDEHRKFGVHTNDSVHSIKDFFTRGIAHGHIRNYTMGTIHEGSLKDYWTNAIGGALRYETAEWNGLSFTVKGIFTFEAFGMDLTEVDDKIGRSAKWEKELYDVRRPGRPRTSIVLRNCLCDTLSENRISESGNWISTRGHCFSAGTAG